jgi:hypothetical protein
MKLSELPIAIVAGARFTELEAFYDWMLGTTAKMVAAGKSVEAHLIFVLFNDGQIAVMPPPGSKDMLVTFQKFVVKEPMVRACAVVFEAWTSHKTEDPRKTNPNFRPADDPDRGEAIVVSILTAGRQVMTTSPIERPSNIVKKAPFQWMDEATGKHSGRFVR